MELTKEYFDQALSNLAEKTATKEGLSKLEFRMDRLESNMATKTDLAALGTELKQYTHDAFEIQQTWMDVRFKKLIVMYDVRERVAVLEKDVAELKLRSN